MKITPESSKKIVMTQILVWTLGFAAIMALFITDYFFDIFHDYTN
jgi:hypothetical protein